MPDLLVRLYALPPTPPAPEGVIVRRANSFELSRVRRFVTKHFGEGWADEAAVALSRQPIGVHLALAGGQIVGFAVVESTARGFFGPTGVDPAWRGKGIGTCLLLAALHDLHARGYAYGIIGWAGPVEFYAKCCGATVIPDSVPGVYANLLAPEPTEE